MYHFVTRAASDFTRTSTFTYLFKSLIRPQLEYASSIWNPFYKKYIDVIDKVQYKFLKFINFKIHKNSRLPYNNLLKKYSLTTLEKRRSFLDAMLLHGLCNNKFDCVQLVNSIKYVVPRNANRRETRAYRLFAESPCRTNAGFRNPLRRLLASYNQNFTAIDIFHLPTAKYRKALSDCLI